MKLLRESSITQKRANEAFHYPEYFIRLQKERQTQAKFARKRCPLNQLYIKITTKINKNICLHFLQVTTFVSQMMPIIVILWKENKNLQYRGKFPKIIKFGFMKTGCSKKKDQLRKIKPLWRANCFPKDKWGELYIEIKFERYKICRS